jgi:hypothetical protein
MALTLAVTVALTTAQAAWLPRGDAHHDRRRTANHPEGCQALFVAYAANKARQHHSIATMLACASSHK